MVFASYIFLFGFLPALLLANWVSPKRYRNLTLLFFSYLFYGWWRPDFILLLAFSTCVDFVCGAKIAAKREAKSRKRWLILSVVVNLGLLAYFKYANFGVDALNEALLQLGLPKFEMGEIVLPVGISFITFQTMSYTIDVYRGDVDAETDILRFATYVSLFPQLVAGPIVRYRLVALELKNPDRFSTSGASLGAVLFLIGLSKKVLLANNLGYMADEAFGTPEPGLVTAWLGLLGYTYQIYFDFSGYSDMAMGLGGLLGFSFPRNFNGPYRSKSITEFWRRWHMTLSEWIRDYLYIPLGGSRGGAWMTYRNLMISMLLCGLWHGANWTFIAWGAYHAGWLLSERALGRTTFYSRAPQRIQVAATMLIVMIGWCLFRANDLGSALTYLGQLLNFDRMFAADAYWTRDPLLITLLAAAALIAARGWDAVELASRRTPLVMVSATAMGLLSVIELLAQGFNPFLYFQF